MDQPTQTREPNGATISIPLLIDDVKSLDDFHMTRCTYFTIDAEAAVDDWVERLRSRGIPFLLIGLSAVIHRPEVDLPHFTHPDQVEALFNRIEQSTDLVVETGHIWLPNEVFDRADDTKETGADESGATARSAVWRTSIELFRSAVLFQRQATSAAQFIEQCRRLTREQPAALEYSPDETEVFRKWSKAQIDAARTHYQHQREVDDLGVLSWIDEHGEVQEG